MEQLSHGARFWLGLLFLLLVVGCIAGSEQRHTITAGVGSWICGVIIAVTLIWVYVPQLVRWFDRRGTGLVFALLALTLPYVAQSGGVPKGVLSFTRGMPFTWQYDAHFYFALLAALIFVIALCRTFRRA